MNGIVYAPISSSVGQKITGSIGKILALGADEDQQTLARVEFGVLTEPESQFTASSVRAMQRCRHIVDKLIFATCTSN